MIAFVRDDVATDVQVPARRQLAVFRHGMTKKGDARGRGSHLSAAGVALARRVGAELGAFHLVAVTPVPRTMETALAMGFAVDAVLEFACGYIAGEFERHAQWEWSTPYVRLAELIRRRGKLAEAAEADAAMWRKLVVDLPPGGRALIVSHGGSIEPVAVACLPRADHASWGGALSHCDGILLSEDQGAFVDIELRRAVVATPASRGGLEA
jgi:broad specificity phosphatase PhoE